MCIREGSTLVLQDPNCQGTTSTKLCTAVCFEGSGRCSTAAGSYICMMVQRTPFFRNAKMQRFTMRRNSRGKKGTNKNKRKPRIPQRQLASISGNCSSLSATDDLLVICEKPYGAQRNLTRSLSCLSCHHASSELCSVDTILNFQGVDHTCTPEELRHATA